MLTGVLGAASLWFQWSGRTRIAVALWAVARAMFEATTLTVNPLPGETELADGMTWTEIGRAAWTGLAIVRMTRGEIRKTMRNANLCWGLCLSRPKPF